jgi:indolepyruvate decarboxylase
MSETVIEHVLGRLKTIGIDDIFGVPGDYAFSVHDAIVHDGAHQLDWMLQ